MAQDRLARLAAMTVVLGLPACTVTMAEGAAPRPAYAPIDMADEYAWIDRADALWEAIGNAPPDYAFVFEGVEPWAWETADGHQIVVEDAGQGGIRSYYFAPGENSPFLAVEPGASFGFSGNVVAVVYGPDGGVVPRGQWETRPERGRLLFARGRLIKRAMIERDRRGVDADAWNDTSGLILTFMGQWESGQQRYPGWRAHRDSAEATDRRQRLERERDRRRGAAGRFDRWRDGGFQGSPPAGFEPRRPGGPRAGRPPQPGQPAHGIGSPERPEEARPARPWRPRPQPTRNRPAPEDPGIAVERDSPRPSRPDAGRQDRPAGAEGHPSRPSRPASDGPPVAPSPSPPPPPPPPQFQPQPQRAPEPSLRQQKAEPAEEPN